MGDWIRLKQAAEILGLSIDTTRRLVDSGRLPAWRTPGGAVNGGNRRVQLEDVLRLRDELHKPVKAAAGG